MRRCHLSFFFFFSSLSLSICPSLSGTHYPIWECRRIPGDIFRNDPREFRWGPEETGMKTSKWSLLRCDRKDAVIIIPFAQEWGSIKPAFNGPFEVCAFWNWKYRFHTVETIIRFPCPVYKVEMTHFSNVFLILGLIVLVEHLRRCFVK